MVTFAERDSTFEAVSIMTNLAAHKESMNSDAPTFGGDQ